MLEKSFFSLAGLFLFCSVFILTFIRLVGLLENRNSGVFLSYDSPQYEAGNVPRGQRRSKGSKHDLNMNMEWVFSLIHMKMITATLD